MDTSKKRQDEATSSETVADLEDEGSFATDNTDETDENGPSPDGAFDEPDEVRDTDLL